MKVYLRRALGTLLAFALISGAAAALDSKRSPSAQVQRSPRPTRAQQGFSPQLRASSRRIMKQVRAGKLSIPAARAALSSSSVDFETPELFSDTLPLQVFQSFQTGAIFVGSGAVIDAASFEVTGATGENVLGFNGRFGENADGSIPQLPELIAFVAPKRTVSVDVGSKHDEGRSVVLIALNLFLSVVDSDSVQITPQMQTLTVSSTTPEILIVGIFGEAELKILAVDNLTYN